MRIKKVLILSIVVLLASAMAWSASFDEARRLFESGDANAALVEINSVLDSDIGADEKAEALDLLGTIAVDEGYLSMARQAWTRLLDEYPDSAAAPGAKTKLQLVTALLKTESAAPEAAPEASAVAPAAAAPPSATTAASEPAATPPPAAPEPAAATPPAAPVQPTPSSGQVLVAARGKPFDAVKLASERIVEFLRQQGVDARSATGGIPVVED